MTPGFILILFVSIKCLQWGIGVFLRQLNRASIHRHPEVPAALSSVLSEQDYRKSQQYSLARQRFADWDDTFELVLLLGFIFLGGFARMESFCVGAVSHPVARAILFCLGLAFLKSLCELPLDLYYTFKLEARFGFNRSTPRLYFMDFIKKWVLTLIIGSLLITFLLQVMRHVTNWWVYGYLGFMAFQGILVWGYPTWIAPLFNKFKPLEPGELKERILAVAQKVGFTLADIFVMDGSRRSSHSNAYFTGFGKKRRIVLFDTLMQDLNTDELEGVLAHEMAHNRLKHIHKNLALTAIFLGLAFYIWGFLVQWSPFYKAFGLSGAHLFPVLLLFPLWMEPAGFLLTPMFNILLRRHEYEADAFAITATGNKDALRDALLKLSQGNLSNVTPHPWYSAFHYSHPALRERLQAIAKESHVERIRRGLA